MIKKLDIEQFRKYGISSRDLIDKYRENTTHRLSIDDNYGHYLPFEQQIIFNNFFEEQEKLGEQGFYYTYRDGEYTEICLFSTGGKLKDLWIEIMSGKNDKKLKANKI